MRTIPIRIPVLLYHDIRADDFDISRVAPQYRPYIHRLSDFKAHMAWLARAGYRTGTIAELANIRPGQTGLNRQVVLAFDDGWRSNYQPVFDIMRSYAFTGTFFVTTDYIGKEDMMSWEHLRCMASAGMEIGSHSRTHRVPIELTSAELHEELAQSKEILQQGLQKPVGSFSSPTGFYDARMPEVAAGLGYKAVCFSKNTCAQNINPRCSIIYKIGLKRAQSRAFFQAAAGGNAAVLAAARLAQATRDAGKRVLGVRGYNRIRSMLLRMRGHG